MEDEKKFAEAYLAFINCVKDEREGVAESVRLARKQGFRPFERGRACQPGDRVYKIFRKKSVIFGIIGRRHIEEGASLLLAHIDSPRLDLKPVPLYGRNGHIYLDTHYYGNIKKYQWVTIPLALHGRIVRKDGTEVTVHIGEAAEDPVFSITDLPPHVSSQQLQKNGENVITGEGLDAIAGSAGESDGAEISQHFIRLLSDRYGITAEDFISSELELVPAFGAKYVGFDKSLIGGYGQDDKVCAFPALQALFSLKEPEYTSLVILTDKEETGSASTTGMQSPYFRDFLEDIADTQNARIRYVLENSLCVSADVITTMDPLYPEVAEYRNMPRLNGGVVLSKYRGLRGKADTQDATAEFMALIRRLLEEREVPWQAGEACRVDGGGGKTAGRFISVYNVDTLDVGVPILSMHSPFEIVAVKDLISAYDAYRAFLERDERGGIS